MDQTVINKMIIYGDDPNSIFKFYNPTLLRFPMQLILQSQDSNELKKAVGVFINASTKSTYITVGNTVYLEYIHKSMGEVVVPEKNWETKIWKASRK